MKIILLLVISVFISTAWAHSPTSQDVNCHADSSGCDQKQRLKTH